MGYNAPMSRRFQFNLRALLGATAFLAVAAVLMGIAARGQELLALWWSLPFFAAGLGLLRGRALPYSLIAAALALFLSFAVMA